MKAYNEGLIEEKIGYCFKNKDLLRQAFTHSSYANEQNWESYERLEYLGDAVLNYIVAKYTFEKYPKFSQKTLTDVRSELVRKSTLAIVIEKLCIIDYIFTSKGDLGKKNGLSDKIKCDLFESILGAIFVDNDFSISEAEGYVLRLLGEKIEYLEKNGVKNYVNEIKERCEKEKKSYHYEVINETNPPKPPFNVVLVVEGEEVSFGTGGTKIEAEQIAAESYFKKLSQ